MPQPLKKAIVIFILCASGCNHRSGAPPVCIALIDHNRSVKFIGLDVSVAGELKRDAANSVWETVLPVFRMPADTDLKDLQKPQPGIYLAKEKTVVFTPDTPFIKGQTYFMRYYRFDEGKSVLDMMRNKTQLGRQAYTDMVFKP